MSHIEHSRVCVCVCVCVSASCVSKCTICSTHTDDVAVAADGTDAYQVVKDAGRFQYVHIIHDCSVLKL